MKFPTLPIRLWTAFAAALVSAGCARPAFEASWRQTLDNADDGLLRVWSIADSRDSLFLRRRAEPVTARMYAAEEFGRLCAAANFYFKCSTTKLYPSVPNVQECM